MKLQYFKGQNFGDALNPFIFDHFLPGFFDQNDEVSFLGIGSILGFDLASDSRTKIVFSSGFAYGEKPQIDSSYDIFCVRGPLTAKALNLPEDKAVADGAILLQYMKFPAVEKKYKFGFIPHWGSEQKYSGWRDLCAAADIKYISPMDDKDTVLTEIRECEVLLAEAMHGAIVADTLGIPWIPVKAYSTINEFKWNDWAESLNLNFQFHILSPMYENNEFMQSKLSEKSKGLIPQFIIQGGLKVLQKLFFERKKNKLIAELKALKSAPVFLSERKVLQEKGATLLAKLKEVEQKYGRPIMQD